MAKSRAMATCAMISALSVVLMILGGILELGMYAAPLFAGLLLIPVGKLFGTKYQFLVWITVSLLCFMLVPLVEQNLIYAAFFGWYPIVRPKLEKLPKVIRLPVKMLIFNGAIIAIEWLVIAVLVPEVLEVGFWIILLVLANITFVLYDSLIPRIEIILNRVIRRGK